MEKYEVYNVSFDYIHFLNDSIKGRKTKFRIITKNGRREAIHLFQLWMNKMNDYDFSNIEIRKVSEKNKYIQYLFTDVENMYEKQLVYLNSIM